MAITEIAPQLGPVSSMDLEAARQDIVEFARVPYGSDEQSDRQQELEGRLQGLLFLIDEVEVLRVGLRPNLLSHSNAYVAACKDFGRSAVGDEQVRIIDVPQPAITSRHALPMSGGNTKNGLRGGMFKPLIDMRIKTSHDPISYTFAASERGAEPVMQDMPGRWYRLPLADILFVDESRNE